MPMKKIFIVFIPTTLWAAPMYDNIQVIRQENNQITLTAKCESIESKIDGIISLSKKIETRSANLTSIIRQRKENLCSVNITPIIPKRILDLHDSTTAYPGPNCWNTSLYTNKIVQSRRSTSKEEMHYWMTSPLCRELKDFELEKAGDIIAIRENNSDIPDNEMHAFIYLTHDLSFSKSGFDTQFPYELISSERVYQTFALGEYGDYKPEKECRKVEGIPDSAKCPVYANVFRCISYEQFLNSSIFPSKNIYTKLDLKVLAFEKKLSDATIWKVNFTKEIALALSKQLAGLEKEYTQYINSHGSDSTLWESIKFRMISYHEQLDLLNKEIK